MQASNAIYDVEEGRPISGKRSRLRLALTVLTLVLLALVVIAVTVTVRWRTASATCWGSGRRPWPPGTSRNRRFWSSSSSFLFALLYWAAPRSASAFAPALGDAGRTGGRPVVDHRLGRLRLLRRELRRPKSHGCQRLGSTRGCVADFPTRPRIESGRRPAERGRWTGPRGEYVSAAAQSVSPSCLVSLQTRGVFATAGSESASVVMSARPRRVTEVRRRRDRCSLAAYIHLGVPGGPPTRNDPSFRCELNSSGAGSTDRVQAGRRRVAPLADAWSVAATSPLERSLGGRSACRTVRHPPTTVPPSG